MTPGPTARKLGDEFVDDLRRPLADDVCDQPAMCATYDEYGDCTRCGYPSNCHDY
jgi:hypothetical protein